MKTGFCQAARPPTAGLSGELVSAPAATAMALPRPDRGLGRAIRSGTTDAPHRSSFPCATLASRISTLVSRITTPVSRIIRTEPGGPVDPPTRPGERHDGGKRLRAVHPIGMPPTEWRSLGSSSRPKTARQEFSPRIHARFRGYSWELRRRSLNPAASLGRGRVSQCRITGTNIRVYQCACVSKYLPFAKAVVGPGRSAIHFPVRAIALPITEAT
jgi:hypothetical protein